MEDIKDRNDIINLVDTFYTKVQDDNLIGPIFKNVIKDNWPEHLEKMYRFWETVVLEAGTYRGTPFQPHAVLPIDAIHFKRWIELFNSTMNELFVGERADKAKNQANTMAILFESKLNYYRTNNIKPLM